MLNNKSLFVAVLLLVLTCFSAHAYAESKLRGNPKESSQYKKLQEPRRRLQRKDCTIIKNTAPIPNTGVVCANPERAFLIASKYFDNYTVHTDFRGFQVYTGYYHGVPLFAANTGLGAPAAAFLVEELIAFDVKNIIRLGTCDYNMTEADLDKVFIIRSERGLVGLMRDYGFPPEQWGAQVHSAPYLVQMLQAKAKTMPNITPVTADGYNIDAFYSFLDPDNVAQYPDEVRLMIKQYEALGATVRDMEAASVLFVGQMRGIATAAVLQAVVKSGEHHEDAGTTGIPLVLETLKQVVINNSTSIF